MRVRGLYEENYNSPALVEIWTDFIDWRKRRLGENGFLVKTLKEHGCKRVLDGTLGEGCDSIYLLKEGFDVASNEIDHVFLERALANARKEKVELAATSFDWREFDVRFEHDSFDAVLILGNSLTYLFSRKDQLRALSAFRNILRQGGVLIVDERNYDYILSSRDAILHGGAGFKYSKKYVYCGERVHARPVEIRKRKVVFRYDHENGKSAFLIFYPFKKGELVDLMRMSGFRRIGLFSDFRKGFDSKADFYHYVAVK